MVLPLIKVFSLVLRVFSKPLIGYTKQMHLKNDGFSHPAVRTLFVNLGNKYNRWEILLNRKFMKIQTQLAYKPLADGLAIEKGIQFFYEIIFYLIVIGLPIYELYIASQDSKQKSAALSKRISQIQSQFEQVSEKIPKIKELVDEIQVFNYKVEGLPSLSPPISLKFANRERHIYHLQYLI